MGCERVRRHSHIRTCSMSENNTDGFSCGPGALRGPGPPGLNIIDIKPRFSIKRLNLSLLMRSFRKSVGTGTKFPSDFVQDSEQFSHYLKVLLNSL
jgi:hypothetical protein